MKKLNYGHLGIIILLSSFILICIIGSSFGNPVTVKGTIVDKYIKRTCEHEHGIQHIVKIKPYNKPFNKIGEAHIAKESYDKYPIGTNIIVNSEDHWFSKDDFMDTNIIASDDSKIFAILILLVISLISIIYLVSYYD